MRRSISFHPKFAAALDALLGLAMLWWLSQIGVWWLLILWFVFRLLLWATLIRLVYYPAQFSRWRHFCSLLVFSTGLALLLLFLEWPLSWYVLGAILVFFSAGSFWLLPPEDNKLPFVPKPHRRWLFFLNVFGLAGIWSGVFAIIAFQVLYSYSMWLLLLFGGLSTAAVSAWWWWEYGIARDRRLLLWSAVWLLLMLELSWVVTFLPLGFLAAGLFLVWFWYVAWLFCRFHLSARGIDWKKQKWFAIINMGLMIIFLALVARWI